MEKTKRAKPMLSWSYAVHVPVYIYEYIYTYIYTYIYMQREREREREGETEGDRQTETDRQRDKQRNCDKDQERVREIKKINGNERDDKKKRNGKWSHFSKCAFDQHKIIMNYHN